jgi:hypothetical protein
MAHFETVDELFAAADLVVVGTRGPVEAYFFDGPPGESNRRPMVLYRFDVDLVVKGDLDRPPVSIALAWIDLERVRTNAVSPVGTQPVLLALTKRLLDHPVLQEAEIDRDVYVPVGGSDNAVFDILEGRLVPRSEEIRGLSSIDDQLDIYLSDLPSLSACPSTPDWR